MAGVPDTAWSLWEIFVTIAGPGGLIAAVGALVRVAKKSGESEESAKRVKCDLEKYRAETKEALAEATRNTEHQLDTVNATIEIVRSDMATKHDLDRLGNMIMDSFRTSISALGVNIRQRGE